MLVGGSGFGRVAVFVELVAKGADADVEQFGGLGAVSFALLQGGQNMASLQLAQGAEFIATFDRRRARIRSETQMLWLEGAAFAAKDDGALDDILQFAHVAGPGMVLQRLHAGVRDTHYLHAVFAGKTLAELISQQRNVLFVFSQRRD